MFAYITFNTALNLSPKSKLSRLLGENFNTGRTKKLSKDPNVFITADTKIL